MTTTTHRTLALIALGAALPGCARQLNERPTLGGTLTTSSFEPTAPASTQPPARSDAYPGTDRSTWPAHVFLVPVDGTVHGPVRHGRVRLADRTARQKGLQPTVDSSLELEGDAGAALALEGILSPFAATLELALLPVSAILEPPFKDDQSPAELYKRSRQGGWSSAPGTTD